ncbi:MAG TPA: PEP/pyruvate-binding domain-containing protein [Candidatus Eisenbacteria bacterium]|nr:PEP/pyruvate-binding domain-containing protein [Candidatus Eisenbacteria bacterium]
MGTNPAVDAVIEREKLFEAFENLMPFRVQDIILVSSLYDSFILREDGRLNEMLIGESYELNLQHVPRITHVKTGAEALGLARSDNRFNLIVANLEVEDMTAAELATEVKRAGLDVPVVVLAYDYREIKNFVARMPHSPIERIFLWQGNARILISIIKYIEDKWNAEHDTEVMGVPVMLVVEDNIRYYSSFLPVIYTELISQARRLISEGLNVAHKLVRMRARPKILLASDYESGAELALRYRENLLGVVLDVEFPRRGQVMPESGFDLARMIRSVVPDVPIVLQSGRTEFMDKAYAEEFSFLQKRSPTLLGDLRNWLIDQVGFGDFVFRLPDRKTEVARASNLNELEQALRTVPAESISYHAGRNHFSHWLMARTEFAVAQKLRPRKVSDFASIEVLRRDLIDAITSYRREQSHTLVGDFNPETFQPEDTYFLRIGDGSLGGKARGLAFARHLLHPRHMPHRFGGVRISVPRTVVLATDAFDRYVAENDLHDFAMRCPSDAEIVERFLASPLPAGIQAHVRAFLEQVSFPLAVRSSSLLEDSQYQPFSGVYDTFMLGNHDHDIEVRLRQLTEAIKRVYASTFSQHSKAYVRATPYRLEEEKMAVLIQQVVGSAHGHRYYPDFSGVVRSRNFYPLEPQTVRDGFAAAALGMGRAVVGGGKCLTFSPRYPRHLVQFSSVEDILANSQTEFWALELMPRIHHEDPADDLRETAFPIKAAEADGTLHMVASTYSAENHAVYDGLSRSGVRIISFAPILKHGLFPLPQILEQLMTVGEDAMGRPVEIEFAVKMPQRAGDAAEFGFLQMRPLVMSREGEELRVGEVEPSRLICQSAKVLGHGRIQDLRDLIVVDYHRFERAQSQDVAQSVAHFNSELSAKGTPYALIGVGRWGSNEPWLGIPVSWDQISGARVIVESGFRDFRVTPSQGSHFFQNLTAFQVGYLTVNPDAGEGFVDWEWLAAQPGTEDHGCVRLLHFDKPLSVVMDAKTSRGMIFKPEAGEPG